MVRRCSDLQHTSGIDVENLLDTGGNLAAMNRNVGGSRDPKPDASAGNFQDANFDSISDDNLLSGFASENKHDTIPFLCRTSQRTGRCWR